MTKLLTSVMLSSAIVTSVATAQTIAPPVCQMGAVCIQDAHGKYVGIGASTPTDKWTPELVTHIFNNQEYTVMIQGPNGLYKGSSDFYFTNPNCTGTAYLIDEAATQQAQADLEGNLWAARRPVQYMKLTAYSPDPENVASNRCWTFAANPAYDPSYYAGPAYIVDTSVARSWVAPFSAMTPSRDIANR